MSGSDESLRPVGQRRTMEARGVGANAGRVGGFKEAGIDRGGGENVAIYGDTFRSSPWEAASFSAGAANT